MKQLISTFLFCIIGVFPLFAQNISITIDDVPNTRKFQKDNFHAELLDKLDSLSIPITVFINEGLIYKTDSIKKNLDLLSKWGKKEYITLGNHTYNHSRYSDVGLDSFKIDIEKGTYLTKKIAQKHNKSLRYFRFPYNDLGKDSIQHEQIDSLLQIKKYISSPFTVESSDWMFNYVYEYYLNKLDFENASKIGNLYVQKTLDYIKFFELLSINKYGRKINQIYLCHDNPLNADYLLEIINHLKTQNYQFISFDETLKDEVYKQEYQYYRKWGVSWFYRWMPTQKERVKWMKKEPNIDYIYDLYNELVNKSKSTNVKFAENNNQPIFLKGYKYENIDGSQFDFSQVKGQVLLLDFWASWCGPCIRAHPDLLALENKINNKKLQIITISIDKVQSDWKDYLSKNKWSSINIRIDPNNSTNPLNKMVTEEGKYKGKTMTRITVPRYYIIDTKLLITEIKDINTAKTIKLIRDKLE